MGSGDIQRSNSGGNLREPPYSVDYEQALLAACMLDGGQDSISRCIDNKITANSFYIPAHTEIYNACLALYEVGSPVDELTVGERLNITNKLEKIGGYSYLSEVNNRIETPAHLMFYAQKVKELELTRRVVRFFLSGLEDAYSGVDDVDNFLEKIEQKVLEIGEDRVGETAVSIETHVDNAVTTLNRIIEKKDSCSGVSSGFVDLDKRTFGLHPAEMIVLAARPSMGKTALALNIAENVVLAKNIDDKKKHSTLLFSLEMSAEQLAIRLLCGRSGVDMSSVRSGHGSAVDQKKLATAALEFKKSPLWIDESANISILEMRAKARRINSQHGLGLIIVDYLQLVSSSDSRVPREQQIAEISRGLKAMAKEINVPVIVLSQLNRESEKEKRQPRLSDLRESGSIEQDADIVLMLSKRFSDDGDTPDKNESDECQFVARELIIAKNRNGAVGTVYLTFDRKCTRFRSSTKDEV